MAAIVVFQTKHLGVKPFFSRKKNLSFVPIISLAATHLSGNALLLQSMNIKSEGLCCQNFYRFLVGFKSMQKRCIGVCPLSSGLFRHVKSYFLLFFFCQEILDARQQRTQRREELASRRSHASLKRMRILSQLAYDPNGTLL